MGAVTLGLVLMLFTAMSRTEYLTCKRQQHRIEAHSGATVQLPCLFHWHGRRPAEYMLVWWFTRGDEDLMAYGWENQLENPEWDPQFTNRTQVGRDWFAEGNATLTLGNLALSDGGSYTCQVTTMNPHKRKTCAEMTLSVQKGPDEGSIRGNCNVSGKQPGQRNPTTRQSGLATEQVLDPEKRSGVRNGSSRTGSPVLLHFSQILILLFLILYVS